MVGIITCLGTYGSGIRYVILQVWLFFKLCKSAIYFKIDIGNLCCLIESFPIFNTSFLAMPKLFDPVLAKGDPFLWLGLFA